MHHNILLIIRPKAIKTRREGIYNVVFRGQLSDSHNFKSYFVAAYVRLYWSAFVSISAHIHWLYSAEIADWNFAEKILGSYVSIDVI